MIGLFASDLDGTLLGATHRVGRQVLSAAKAACDSDRHFAVATGRTLRSTDDLGFSKLPIEAICANGAIVLGRDSEVMYHVPLDADFVGELLESFPQVSFECISLDHTYLRISKEQWEEGWRRRMGLLARVAMRGMRMREGECVFDQTDARILSHEIVKVNCRISDDPALTQGVLDFVAAHVDRAINAPFSVRLFEITDPRATKGDAVAWLARQLGLSEGEVAVYGDGGNDLTMLSRFEHSYAPSGAIADAKRAATKVIGSNLLYAVPRHIRSTVRRERRASRA